MTDTPVIETARLRLRELVIDDAASLFEPLSDADLLTWWSHPPLASVDAVRDYLGRPDAKRWRGWAITLQGDDRAIGWVSVGERRAGVSEIGYILARAHWGSGIAREGVGAVIDYLFSIEGHRRLFADTDPDNAASNALLTKLGFTIEGRLRAEWETHIGVRDSLIWGLLAGEWRAARPD